MVYKNIPLCDVPTSTAYTRSRNLSISGENKIISFLKSAISEYIIYVQALIDNLMERFQCKTFAIAKEIGKLINLDSLVKPSVQSDLQFSMNPLDIESKDDFHSIIDALPFHTKIKLDSLYFEFGQFKQQVCSIAANLRNSNSTASCLTTVYLLKKFVAESGPRFSDFVTLLSFCCSFPVSEAIMESWGSTIDHLYQLKHNPSENVDDLSEPGTIEKLTYIKLNGPSPGKESNRHIFVAALYNRFKGNFASHFRNHAAQIHTTSKVVHRINTCEAHTLPCYTK